MIAARHYTIFISYRHADNKESGRQWATWLHQALEGYEIPADLVGTRNSKGGTIPASLYPVFRDEEELPADADLTRNIRQALQDSSLLVVICSPRAVESKFVEEEIRHFKELGKSDRILPFIIDGEPNASDRGSEAGALAECFPEPMRFGVSAGDGRIDWSRRAEPIAADARPEGKPEQGWTTGAAYHVALLEAGVLGETEIRRKVRDYEQRLELAKLKVLAGALDVPLGLLTERDQAFQLDRARKRQRVIIRVALALAALFCLAVAGGVIALVKQGEAQAALREQKRLSFDAVVRNAIADDEIGESNKVITGLTPYFSDADLARHPMHAKAEMLLAQARDGYRRLSTFAGQARKGRQSVALDLAAE